MKKTYQQLTPGEKLIVGIIYEQYMKWSTYGYLKSASFIDFKIQTMSGVNEEFEFYADYFYMHDYEEELKENKVNSLTKFLENSNNEISKRWVTKESKKETFISKLFKSK